MTSPVQAPDVQFDMPRAVAITGRISSITNSFINAIIPVVPPTADEIRTALRILGMSDGVVCAYCGDPSTEWDHLRPLVLNKKPTGYISEIHNLVPACGKCNQSKGNRHWQDWMFGTAKRSPSTRGVSDIEVRAERLTAYEKWLVPTVVDFEDLVGTAAWSAHWERYDRIVELMIEAQSGATDLRQTVKATYLMSADERQAIALVDTTSAAAGARLAEG